MGTETFFTIDVATQQLITSEQAWHYKIVPNKLVDCSLHCYVVEKQDLKALKEELEVLLGYEIVFHYADEVKIEETLHRYFRLVENKVKEYQSVDIKDTANFFKALIREAKMLSSSDIHFEIYEDRARIRFRIDGLLIEKYAIELTEYPALINKIKIQAHLDISEKRLPQDGRIYFEEEGEKFDIRVSILPTLYGEKGVLRILGSNAEHLDLDYVGFKASQLIQYKESVAKPNGIILISGPTGSGKTTTLYATLKLLNETKRNILTIEDPIEYTLAGINQVQLKEGIGLDFQAALKTFLRQDPDIIMLGEIRDVETAQMAIRTSLTGHLVLSTIHTNSALETITRLLDMGIPGFLLASTLNLSVAQRLIRTLCNECKEEAPISKTDFPAHFIPPSEIHIQSKAKGCANCFYTGYKGRKAIYEVLPMDSKLSRYVKKGDFGDEDLVNELLPKDSLASEAFKLLELGQTSLEEVYPLLLDV